MYSHELEAVVQRCSAKKGVLRNFTKCTENTCARVFFLNKVADLRPATLLKKWFWHWYFPRNFAKFLRTPFFTEQLWWLLLTNGIVFLCIWSMYVQEHKIKNELIRIKRINSANIIWYVLFLDIHRYSHTKCYWKTFPYHLCQN